MADLGSRHGLDEGCPPSPCMPRAETWPPGCLPAVEVCNAADDDCDGTVDEGCVPSCTPQPEICNGTDDDCDGMVDEGCPPGIF